MKRLNWLHILIITLLPLTIGVFTFQNYGESIDENPLYIYSAHSLKAYEGLSKLELDPKLGKGNFRYYGPAFLMATNVSAQIITQNIKGISMPEAWHFVYFLSFLACGIGLYFLAKKWFFDDVAFAITLLFLFQPMLWGHAFINPKDIPFMTFGLWSILASLTMQARIFPHYMPWESYKATLLTTAWQKAEKKQRLRTTSGVMGLVIIISLYLFGQTWLEGTATYLLGKVYSAKAGSLSSNLFALISTDYKNIPLEYYISKSLRLINYALVLTGTVLLLKTISQIWKIIVQPTQKNELAVFMKYLRSANGLWVIGAGILLGITTSIRILGPALGFIALVISLYKAKAKALPVFTFYFLVASVTTYITWPYLWQNPINRLWVVLSYMSSFPWTGKVLFNGIYFPINDLPIGYVPVLFGIQFTEPVVFLFIFGLFLFGRQVWQRTLKVEFSITMLLWGILPFLAFTALRPSLYDNIRQLLFITPPLFLVIGLAVEWIHQRLGRPLFTGLILILLMPGIIAIKDLHPYQYTYYNSFIKEANGSNQKFETDYWAISFRDAMEHLNQIAPQNSKILVYVPGNKEIAEHFSRPDLIVNSDSGTIYDPITGFDYVIITTRFDWDSQYYKDWPTIYTVQRNNNVFAVVRQRP